MFLFTLSYFYNIYMHYLLQNEIFSLTKSEIKYILINFQKFRISKFISLEKTHLKAKLTYKKSFSQDTFF